MATEGPDNVTRLPAEAPAVLRGHPALVVEWLRLVNLLSRWRQGSVRTAMLLSIVIVVAGLLAVALSVHVSAAVETLARSWLLVAAVTAIFAWTTVGRRRRHVEESQSQSWLIATPISPSSLRLSSAIRTLFPVVAVFAAVLALSLVVILLNYGVAPAVGRVIAAFSAGLFIGGVAGWWIAGREPKQTGVVAPRYVPSPRFRSKSEPARVALKPDASALSRWPILQVLSWSRPDNSRYVLIVALLAVQGGSSAIAGLSVVAMYFIASYLGTLLLAMMPVAKSAASWLRSTPMTLSEFVWSLMRRALVHQLAGTAVAVVVMLLLDAPLAMAVQIGALWLGLVISVSGFALAENYRGRSPLARIALSAAAFAALATLMQIRVGAKI
ncbi:MAG TPA: hypothetical protein VGD45_22125 [Steroidobacter sp.]|uniref:hypothetical protein n=1 Tax=Steroidobacter sp. TaxID=1978227 RepID=UPI002ED77F7F